MNRFFITFIVGSFSTLSAAEDHPHSPTHQYHVNFQRIVERIDVNKENRDSIRGQLALLEYSDQRDLHKSQTAELKAVKAQKEINRVKYAQELKKLKKELKRLTKEKQRLESTL